MGVLEQLQQLIGNDWSTEHLRQLLPQITALGIHVQNEARGDLRPRFLLPDGNTWDFGPEGWIGRGNIGNWHEGTPNDEPGGQPGGDDKSGRLPNLSNDGGGLPPEITPVIPDNSAITSFLRATPGYGFAFDEGQRAAQTGAAARGTLLTGGTLKALARFGTGLADQTYDDAVRRYLSVSDLGARTAVAPF